MAYRFAKDHANFFDSSPYEVYHETVFSLLNYLKMLASQHPYFVYASVLEPWTRLAISTPSVIGLRLGTIPWLWVSNPARASAEVHRMFNEKNDALVETGIAIAQMPVQFWMDAVAATFSADPVRACYQAMIRSSNRVARPSGSRVRANQKRLSRQKR